jgi:hypothetical protein
LVASSACLLSSKGEERGVNGFSLNCTIARRK